MSDLMVRSIKNALAGGSVRYQSWPDLAGVALISAVGDGVMVWHSTATSIQVVAAGVVASPCWIVGVSVLQSTWAAATTYGEIRVGTGALAAEVWLAQLPVLAGVETAVGLGMKAPIWLPYPIKVTGSPRICASIRNSTGGLITGCTVKVLTCTGLD